MDGIDAVILLFLLFIAGMLAGGGINKSMLRAQAIERGYAGYCPDTGYWAWRGECDAKGRVLAIELMWYRKGRSHWGLLKLGGRRWQLSLGRAAATFSAYEAY